MNARWSGLLRWAAGGNTLAPVTAAIGACAALMASALPASANPTYVGANLPWLAYGHSFGTDGLYGYASSYSSTVAQAAFDDMKSKHLNICRVFLFDDLEGVISGGNVDTIITPSSTYIANLTDFVTRANADGITVYATLFNAWDFVTYPSTLKNSPATIFNNSALYSSTGPLETVSKALAGKQVIWDFLNEGNNMAQYYSGGWVDLVGWVTMNTWLSNARAAIRAGGSTGNFTISDNDPNVLLYNLGTSNSSDLLNKNNLDFYDCHEYNDTGTITITSSSIGDGKPVFTGEFGPSSQDWSTTSDNVTTLVEDFWNTAVSEGDSGLLIWSYLNDGSGNETEGTAELSELATLAGGSSGGGTTVPAAPTGLTATAGNAQVALSWTASSGATSYNVYRGTSSGGEGTTAIVTGLTSPSYTNTGLTNGTAYYYKVAAVNSAGTSALSSEASATPTSGTSAPSAPTGLTATAGNAQVALSWSASSGATSYNVYRSTTSGGEGSTPLVSGLTTTSYTNTGLTNGTTYYYKVAAVNSAGTSAQSGEVSAKPSSGSSGSGPLTFAPSLPANSQYYTQYELAVTVPSGTSVTTFSATITAQLKSGDVYANEWTNGGSISESHNTGSAITFTFALSSGTLANGQQLFGQINTTATQPVSGDTYSVSYTANGTQYTATGSF